MYFVCSSRRRHTRCALVTGVRTCALPISGDDEVHVLSNDRGFVIGDIFRRHVPTKAFGAYKGAQEEVTDILVNGEANEQVWGDYIAIYFDRSQELQLLHAPCGSLNLFFLELEGALLFASESSILLTVARQRRSIRWAGIAESILSSEERRVGKEC